MFQNESSFKCMVSTCSHKLIPSETKFSEGFPCEHSVFFEGKPRTILCSTLLSYTPTPSYYDALLSILSSFNRFLNANRSGSGSVSPVISLCPAGGGSRRPYPPRAVLRLTPPGGAGGRPLRRPNLRLMEEKLCSSCSFI